MSRRALAICSLLVVVAIWGSTFVATKLLLDQIGPIGVALLRFAVASAILVPLADWRGARPLPWGRFALLGLTGVVAYFVCQNVGLVYTSASAASLIIACVPICVGIAAVVFLREVLSLRRVAGVASSVVGVALIVLAGRPEPSAPAPLLGNLLILGAAVAWAAYTTMCKGLERLSFRVISAATVGFGAIFLLPLAAWEHASRGAPSLTVGGWLGILYLGAGASAAAYFLWNYALRHLDAAEAAVFLNLVPLVGVVIAAVVLRESIGPFELAGGALVVAGVTLATRSTTTRREETPESVEV